MKYGRYYIIDTEIIEYIAEDNKYYYGTVCYIDLNNLPGYSVIDANKRIWKKVDKEYNKVAKFEKKIPYYIKEIGDKKDLFLEIL